MSKEIENVDVIINEVIDAQAEALGLDNEERQEIMQGPDPAQGGFQPVPCRHCNCCPCKCCPPGPVPPYPFPISVPPGFAPARGRPIWSPCYSNTRFATYDHDSVTVYQDVGRLRAAVNDLTQIVNQYADWCDWLFTIGVRQEVLRNIQEFVQPQIDTINQEINSMKTTIATIQAAVQQLQNDLALEKTQRIAGDQANANAIAAEATTRAQAISSEQATRTEAVNNLRTDLTAEIANRKTADTHIRQDLDKEIQNRIDGDEHLQAQINGISNKYIAAYGQINTEAPITFSGGAQKIINPSTFFYIDTDYFDFKAPTSGVTEFYITKPGMYKLTFMGMISGVTSGAPVSVALVFMNSPGVFSTAQEYQIVSPVGSFAGNQSWTVSFQTLVTQYMLDTAVEPGKILHAFALRGTVTGNSATLRGQLIAEKVQ